MVLKFSPLAHLAQPEFNKTARHEPLRAKPGTPLRRTLGMATVVLLAGCVTATQPLWRNTLEAPTTALAAGLAVNAAGEAYQLFTLGGALYLRKLSASGEEQWRHVVNESGGNLLSAQIVTTDTDVFVTPTPSSILRISSDGTQQTPFSAAPDSPYIHELEATPHGTLLVSYSQGVAEFGEGGQERWRHEWSTPMATHLARLSTGAVLVVNRLSSSTARILLLDAQGNQLGEENAPINDPLFTLIQGNNGQFIVHGNTITRLSNEGTALWSHSFDRKPTCTAGDNGEVACWFYQEPYIYPPYSYPGHASISWLNADGTIKSTYGYDDYFPMLNRIEALYYNGNHRWTLQKFIRKPANLFTSSSPPKHYHYNAYSVLSESGFLLKNINMTPAVFQISDGDNPDPGSSEDGDVVAATVIRQGKLFSSGNTRLSRQGFVSTYTVP